MDMNAILLIGGICIVMGFLLGLIIANLGGSKKDESSQTDKEAVLQVWREPGEEGLIIGIDGGEFDTSAYLNEEQHSNLHTLILKLNDWLSLTPSGIPETAGQSPVDEIAIDQDSAPDMTPKPTLNPVTMFVKALQSDVQKSKLPSESMITQIDDILQERLKDSPLAGKPIRLMELPTKGMVVMIGLDQYDTVDDVPDPAIQDLIRASVKEWEDGVADETGRRFDVPSP